MAAARQLLDGQRLGWYRYLAFAGPAVVASIAYMDPGNFATNIQAGAKYGYGLLWVVMLANLIAMLFQALSAKLGIVTGRNLAEMCREEFPRPVVWAMWAVSEIAAMATDLAEFLGGAIGLSLLFGIPLLAGMAVTAVIVYGILLFERARIPAGRADHRQPRRRHCALLPDRIVHCAGRLGLGRTAYGPAATRRYPGAAARRRHHRRDGNAARGLSAFRADAGADSGPQREREDEGSSASRTPKSIVALTVAGLVNMAMVMMASGAFHAGHPDVAEIETAYHTLAPLLGGGSGRRVPRLAARLRGVELGGRDDGRPDDHAGLCRLRDPDLGATARHDAAGLCCRRPGRQCDERARHQPGRAQHRAPAPDDRPHHLHEAPRPHGALRQSPADAFAAGIGTAVVLTLNALLIAETFGLSLTV